MTSSGDPPFGVDLQYSVNSIASSRLASQGRAAIGRPVCFLAGSGPGSPYKDRCSKDKQILRKIQQVTRKVTPGIALAEVPRFAFCVFKNSRLMGCRHVRLRDEFGERNSGEDEQCTGGGPKAEPFAGEKK